MSQMLATAVLNGNEINGAVYAVDGEVTLRVNQVSVELTSAWRKNGNWELTFGDYYVEVSTGAMQTLNDAVKPMYELEKAKRQAKAETKAKMRELKLKSTRAQAYVLVNPQKHLWEREWITILVAAAAGAPLTPTEAWLMKLVATNPHFFPLDWDPGLTARARENWEEQHVNVPEALLDEVESRLATIERRRTQRAAKKAEFEATALREKKAKRQVKGDKKREKKVRRPQGQKTVFTSPEKQI